MSNKLFLFFYDSYNRLTNIVIPITWRYKSNESALFHLKNNKIFM